MEAIKFVNDLKHTLWNIDTSGGNPAVYVTPNHDLLAKLRQHIFEIVGNQNISVDDSDWRNSSFFGDLLDNKRFKRRIRYCIIRLREFSIPEDEFFAYISQALRIVLERYQKYGQSRKFQRQSATTLQNLLIEEIAKCFEIWYYPSDVFHYDFAIEHQLATFDYSDYKWKLSSIGHYLLKLSIFDAIVFLCSLEIVFGKEGTSNRYLNQQTLERLLNPQVSSVHRRPHERSPISLRWYGVIDSFSKEPTVTDLGMRILAKVSANLEVLRETILLLTESEVGGFHYSERADLINQIKERTRTSRSIVQDQKESIDSAVTLFMTGHYLDSLRLFYSNIEAVLNLALAKKGMRPEDFSGMKSKIERLEKEKVLSSKLSTWLEVVTSRNKVFHGNIVEDDAELVRPLFLFHRCFLESFDRRSRFPF
ncbi:MAG: hypothetical protein ACP5ON_11365 [Bacteroidota bacterium]